MNLKEINNRLMYQDRLSVSRYTVTEEEDGSNKRVLTAVSELSDIPCRLDIKRADDPELPEDVNQIKVTYTVFSNPEHVFRAGDHLIVTHQGSTYELTAGNPILYLHHQEVPAIEEKLA